jgi:hypothetical protein
MRVFFSKYELRMKTLKEHQFIDRDNTLIFSGEESCDITEMYRIKLK